MLKVTVIGARGRMGKNICEVLKNDPETEISGLAERPGHEEAGLDIDGIKINTDLEKALSGADAAIDFSTAEGSIDNAAVCSSMSLPLVIGTTGLSDGQIEKISAYSKNAPVLVSPNMSVGVNLIFKLVREITELLPDYEKEIIEAHHSRKVDSPSGTAKMIADIIAGEDGRLVYGRKGQVGPRDKKEVGVHSVRGGDIVGEHTVMWISPYDRIELTHRAASRKMFAEGAVLAAKWLAGKDNGLYSMSDVLK